MNTKQRDAALKAMTDWLSHPQELGKAPSRIECVKEFDLHGLHYYIFRFKKSFFDKWRLAVCGGYEEDSLEHCGHIFSEMAEYNDKTAVDDTVKIVEKIRAYWMERAAKQDDLNSRIKANSEFCTADTLSAESIAAQFVRTESLYFLTVGEVDCPTGQIVTADPLAYLPSRQFSPVLESPVPPGRYRVDVSIFRNDFVGLRMCTAMMRIKETRAVKYVKAKTADGTGVALKDGTISGFPVDAGMMCFCDAQVADEYRAFLDRWHEENPDGNHYDDYFAPFFADSYKKFPAYQRQGGDFIEWTNPDTGNRMVMIASGLGDGFYCAYYGYDDVGDICRIIVPMVDPSLFE